MTFLLIPKAKKKARGSYSMDVGPITKIFIIYSSQKLSISLKQNEISRLYHFSSEN